MLEIVIRIDQGQLQLANNQNLPPHAIGGILLDLVKSMLLAQPAPEAAPKPQLILPNTRVPVKLKG